MVSQNKTKLSEIDLTMLNDLARSVGKAMPRTKFITAPEINELALQSVFLRTHNLPFVRWVLSEGFFLKTNQSLHAIDDMVRGIFMALVVEEATKTEQEMSKKEIEGDLNAG